MLNTSFPFTGTPNQDGRPDPRSCRRLCMLFMALLLSAVCLTVQAQDVHVTLSADKATIEEVLTQIEQKTHYCFVYDKDKINVNKRVSLKVRNQNIQKVLDELLTPNGIAYKIDNKNIVLTALKAGSASQTERLMVEGNVTDEEGEPLAGASVVSSSGTGVTTDVNGNFTLWLPKGSEITVSFIGYRPFKKTILKNESLRISLNEDNNLLSDVVVVGYGTQKKVNLTGSVAVVDGDELSGRTANNMTQLLQGAVPNMNIRMTNGRPGEGGSINIRGVQTVSGSASGLQPLVLIDGVEGDINTVNPNDVESISVLKDASSAAIYGARAAFGVILVTTKSGEHNQTKVSYSGSYSFSAPTVCTDFETRGYYSAAINDMFFTPYQGKPYTTYNDEDYYELWIRRNDKTEHPDRPWVMIKDGEYKYYANFDWYKHLYNNKRPTWNHNVTVNGGTDKVRYWISGGFHSQEGIDNLADDKFTKYNFRSKLEVQTTKWLKFSNNTSYYHQVYDYKGLAGIASRFGDYASHCLASDVPRNPDGTLIIYPSSHPSYSSGTGKIAVGENGKNINKDQTKTFQTTFEAIITPFRQLQIVGNYTYQDYTLRYMNRSSSLEYSNVPGEIVVWDTGSAQNKLTQRDTFHRYYGYNIYATFEDTYAGAHNVKATVGANYETKRYEDLTVSRTDLLSEDLIDFNLATGETITLTGGKNIYKLFGLFYRVNYDYKGKYLFETSGRYDGSSRFQRGHRYGFFPSFSAGWRISEENFFADAHKTVNNLKLRLSYGQLGNQQSVGYYDYIQTISTSGTEGYLINGERIGHASVSSPNAADLTWEKVITTNIGVDLGMFNNRLSFSGDIYQRDTKDILTNGMDLPSLYGASIPKMNAADIRTKGWEITLGWMDQFQLASRPFRYSATFGLADNTAKVRHFNNPEKLLGTPYDGQNLGDIWGYEVDGYFKTDEEAANYETDQTYVNSFINTIAVGAGLHAGDLKFIDLDGDNVIQPTLSANKPRDQKVIGNSMPRYTYSARLTAEYAGFDLAVLFQGVGKQDWYPGEETFLYWGPYSRPYQTFIPTNFMQDVWSEDNPDAKFPRPIGYVGIGGGRRELSAVNTKYLENVAYCRLKNLTLGYTLPRKLLRRAGIDRLRVYFSGENLLTFTPLSTKYIDPEIAGAQNTWAAGKTNVSSTYPTNKQFTFGLNITF